MSGMVLFSLGVLGAVVVALRAGRRENNGRAVLAVALVGAAAIYVLFALMDGAWGWVGIELVGTAAFGALAWLGLRGSLAWLAAGWAVHPVWDAGLHFAGLGEHGARWYVILCVGFDLTLAAMIAWRAVGSPVGSRVRAVAVRAAVAVAAMMAGLLAMGAASQATASRVEARGHRPPGSLVDIGGRRLHIHCTGMGSPTVVLEAGLGESSVSWGLVQPRVARVTRTCSYDRAGLGWSDAGPDPRYADAIVADLTALLDAAGVEGPLVMVGHSFGGPIVRLFAYRVPARVQGLALIDAAHEEQLKRLPPAPAAMRTAYRALAGTAWLGSHRLILPALESLEPALPDSLTGPRRAVIRRADHWRTIWAEYAALPVSYEQVRTERVRHERLRLPLVVVSAGRLASIPGMSPEEADVIARAWEAMQAELAASSDTGQRVVAEDATHHLPVEAPEIVVEAIVSVVEAARTAEISRAAERGS